MHADDVELLVSAPTDRSRKIGNVFIVLFFLFQVLVPLRYYLGGPEADERFSWRMFSSFGKQSCSVSAYETIEQDGRYVERPLPLETLLHRNWINQFRGYFQPDLVRRFMHLRCGQAAIREVRYERTCSATDGTPVAPYRVSMDCESGLVRSPGSTP